MSTDTVKLKATDEDDAALREEFLRAATRINVGRDFVVELVEAYSGRPFAACGAADLLPVLEELVALIRSATGIVTGEHACAE